MPNTLKNICGLRFARLFVTARGSNSARGSARWWCRCVCGQNVLVRGSDLRNGSAKSCGCYRSEQMTEGRNALHVTIRKHGLGDSQEYDIWKGIMRRCYDRRQVHYADYGGRGIAVCERWHDVVNFVADMGPRPQNTSIERIDNNRGYEPGNCRWATRTEQARNTRANVCTEIDGRRMCLAEVAELSGISRAQITRRFRAGLRGADLVAPPRKAKQ